MLCLFGKVYENVPAHNEIAVLWIGILQKVCLMELNLTLDLFRDPEGFTNPGDVISRDPILQAFYETTLGNNGASRRIFEKDYGFIGKL